MQDGLVVVMLRAATQHFEYLCFFFMVRVFSSEPYNYRPVCTVGLTAWFGRRSCLAISPLFSPVCLPSTTPKRLLGLQLPSSIVYLQMVPFGLFSLLHLKGELNSNGKWCACLIARVNTSGQWVKGGRATEWQKYTNITFYFYFIQWLLWAYIVIRCPVGEPVSAWCAGTKRIKFKLQGWFFCGWFVWNGFYLDAEIKVLSTKYCTVAGWALLWCLTASI